MKQFLFAFLCSVFSMVIHANENTTASFPAKPIIEKDTNQTNSVQKNARERNYTSKKENKKLIAAILAFPVPFGFLGLHRIYLGTEPWVPVIYLITAGGGMILPLIDFIAILCADKDELKKYENNPKLFMWMN